MLFGGHSFHYAVIRVLTLNFRDNKPSFNSLSHGETATRAAGAVEMYSATSN